MFPLAVIMVHGAHWHSLIIKVLEENSLLLITKQMQLVQQLPHLYLQMKFLRHLPQT